MSLHVVPDASTFTPDRTRGVVVIESDQEGPPFHAAFHELEGQESKHIAQNYAAQVGLGTAFINGNSVGPYPINSEGVSLDNVRGSQGEVLPPTHVRMQPYRYRVEIPVARPFR